MRNENEKFVSFVLHESFLLSHYILISFPSQDFFVGASRSPPISLSVVCTCIRCPCILYCNACHVQFGHLFILYFVVVDTHDDCPAFGGSLLPSREVAALIFLKHFLQAAINENLLRHSQIPLLMTFEYQYCEAEGGDLTKYTDRAFVVKTWRTKERRLHDEHETPSSVFDIDRWLSISFRKDNRRVRLQCFRFFIREMKSLLISFYSCPWSMLANAKKITHGERQRSPLIVCRLECIQFHVLCQCFERM